MYDLGTKLIEALQVSPPSIVSLHMLRFYINQPDFAQPLGLPLISSHVESCSTSCGMVTCLWCHTTYVGAAAQIDRSVSTACC